MKPTINAVQQEKEPNTGDLKEIVKAFRDIGYEEAFRDVGNNSVPVYHFLKFK